MTSDLCSEDVVVHITAPQIISSETIVPATASSSRVAATSASVELGRHLLLAARAGDTALVLDLMAKGAPFTTDWLGTSPLHLAAGNAHAGTCAVLLRAGVSRDARTKVERTPLHLAAYGGHAEVTRLLLDAGAALDCRDMLRMTPLHWAVQRGHTATVVELLARGADANVVSKFNKTPRSIAQELRREDLVRLIDDAVREREAAKSVHHLVTEQMSEAAPQEPQLPLYDAVPRAQTTKTNKTKQDTERVIKTDTKCKSPPVTVGGEGAAAQLLRAHGITLLPADDTSTVLSALQNGRTVVLSDAGKLMLKESESTPSAVNKVAAGANKSMVLTATPVKSPPKPGMKIFTLNNKLLAVPKGGTRVPVKKIIHPQDVQQMKLLQLPNEVARRGGAVTSRATPTAVTPAGRQRPAVKIIMNKSNFTKLMANASRAEQTQQSAEPPDTDDVMEGESDGSAQSLRAALAASRRALAALQRELRATRARLAKYEDVHAT